MNRERLVKRIINSSTEVYDKGGVKVYASINTDDINLKEIVGLRVVVNDVVSANKEVEILSSTDPVKVLKGIIGSGGLTVRDVEHIGNNIIRDYATIKRVKGAERYGIAEIIGEMYQMLKERCITRAEAEVIDPNMVESVLIEDGQFRMKAGVFDDIADELSIDSKLLRQELQYFEFMHKGVKKDEKKAKRDDKGLSLKGKKLRLLAISAKDLEDVFGDAEEADQEDTASA